MALPSLSSSAVHAREPTAVAGLRTCCFEKISVFKSSTRRLRNLSLMEKSIAPIKLSHRRCHSTYLSRLRRVVTIGRAGWGQRQ
jgi:hypothetical protein